RALTYDRQASVLRAFGLYFQLANMAEQHHRVRRRRDYELEGRVARESLEETFALLDRHEAAAAAAGLSLELVLTAHPTEAARRTVLAAHLRMSGLLERLDEPRLTGRERAAVEGALATEVTALWQADEVRSRRRSASRREWPGSRTSCWRRSRATSGSFPTTRPRSAPATMTSRTGASSRSSGTGSTAIATTPPARSPPTSG